ncbi:MAG: hypothetical protein AAGU21_11875 [Solidesulfovibrio sp.]|uniref:hypothetical protein n=1 Tax=Solidesulfovibrio sp. TaxID=2910990 RepID=UPI003159471B
MTDTPASGKPRQKNQARIIHRPGAVQMNPAWPVEEPDPQFDPGTVRPVEMSEMDNASDKPTNDIAEEMVTAPVATLNTAPADDATVSKDAAPLTAYEVEDQPEKTKSSTPETQDVVRENIPAEPTTFNDAGAGAAENTSATSQDMSDGATEVNETQTVPNTNHVTEGKKETGSELTKEIARQTAPKTPQAYGQEWLSLFRVLTEDGPAEVKNQALSQFNTRIDDFKNSMIGKSVDEKSQIVSATVGIISPVMMKADAFRCLCFLMIGELGNHFKPTIPHGEWAETSRKLFPGTESRDLQQAMRLAKVRKAALYCHLGKTRLSHLAAIASKAPFSSADDPIGMVLSQVQGHLGIIPEEYDVLAKAAIADSNLKKRGLFIDQHVLREFYEYGEEIIKDDIDELLAWKMRSENGESELTPTDFLRAALKNDGKRVFELTDPNGKSRKGKGKLPTIPNINSMLEKTRETIQLALDNLDPKNLKVDQELYHTLMTTLKNFGETVFPS